MALGFQRQGIFGRKPMFPQDDILSNGPYGTPGFGDGWMQRQSEMEPMNANPNAMPIGVKEITKKPGLFSKDSMLWKVLGTLGDAFSDGPPIYTQSILQQRDAEERARMAQQQRMQKREDFIFEKNYERQNPTPKEPTAMERNFAYFQSLTPEQRAEFLKYQDFVNPLGSIGPDGRFYSRPRFNMPEATAPVTDEEWESASPIGGQSVTPTGGFR